MTADFESCRAAALQILSVPGAAADPARLTEVIALLREAADLLPAGHPERAGYLSNVGNVHRMRYTAGGGRGDLDKAIWYGQQALAAADPADPRRAGILANLCGTLRLRFERSRRLADLDAAIEAGTDALRSAADDDPNRADMNANLAIAHQARFEQAAALSELDAAIAEARTAVGLAGANRWTHRSNLAGMLWLRYQRNGRPDHLDESITAGRQAIEEAPDGDPLVAATLSHLSIALRLRFERAAGPGDLDEAITAGERGDGHGGSRAPGSSR